MDTKPSTVIQWTMRLSDAGLISDTLLAAAESEDRSADYLSSDRYAEDQRRKRKALPKDQQGPEWELSEDDKRRIVAARAKAVRLRVLADS